MNNLGSPVFYATISRSRVVAESSRISIVECKTLQDLEIFIEVNASGRDWPLDHSVYEMTRHIFPDRENDHFYYLLYVDDKPACTATILQFGGKYNLNLLSTHKQFQRRGLMHYLNIWIAQNLNKDFYVQVNHNEPSYIYYSQLAGAEVVNTEVKYVVKSEHSGQ